MPLHPKLVQFTEVEIPPLRELGVEAARTVMDQFCANLQTEDIPSVLVVNRTVTTGFRETPVRIYQPEQNGIHPAFIFIHGGGFVLGNLDSYNFICKKIASELSCKVISIDYGLAPENKFPQPVEECYEVSKWIYQNAAEIGVDPNRISIGGDSAGGSLSAIVSILARDRREFLLVYQVLIYPGTDLGAQTTSKTENAHGYFLTTADLNWFYEQYTRTPDDYKHPLASPLLNHTLQGLPPACVITAEYDPLRDEGELYAKKLAAAGVEVCQKRYDGLIHGFLNMQELLEEAQDALALICQKLGKIFTS